MYRTAVEYILGIHLAGDKLFVSPAVPKRWPKFEATIRFGTATYAITVDNTAQRSTGVSQASVDDVPVATTQGITLVDDGKLYRVTIVMGEPAMEGANNVK
jgi:cyclic beta-1,2-glucan synthetase